MFFPQNICPFSPHIRIAESMGNSPFLFSDVRRFHEIQPLLSFFPVRSISGEPYYYTPTPSLHHHAVNLCVWGRLVCCFFGFKYLIACPPASRRAFPGSRCSSASTRYSELSPCSHSCLAPRVSNPSTFFPPVTPTVCPSPSA